MSESMKRIQKSIRKEYPKYTLN